MSRCSIYLFQMVRRLLLYFAGDTSGRRLFIAVQSIDLISRSGVEKALFLCSVWKGGSFFIAVFLCGVALIYYVLSGRKLFYSCVTLIHYVLSGRELFIAVFF